MDELRVQTDLDDEKFIVSELITELKTIGQLRQVYTLFPHMAQRLKVAIHMRLAFCAANVVLLLVAIPYAFQQENRNALVGIGVGLLVAIAYYLVSMFCEYLGNNANLTPSVAGWLPIVVFGVLGVFLFRSMPT
jgi:lipopolysaccharide export LptBFGC system permease protein LptF